MTPFGKYRMKSGWTFGTIGLELHKRVLVKCVLESLIKVFI